ncbi:MAG: MATE family efflux transporter, partial [Fretibacterium sp.]|nr:MATE family efflux transporter [Fretibacterium sp.]
MTEKLDKKNDFTTGNIPLKLIRFMLPILGALILQAMYGAVDIMIVGKFGTTAGISGVSTGGNIVNLVIFAISGLSMGITVLIARYLGERQPERIGKLVGGTVCFFSCFSLVLTILLPLLARPLALLMQAPEEALDLTVTYIRICGGGIFFVIAYNVISGIFRGLGDSMMPLIFVAIACVVNILGDLFFVAVLNMNVVGAALATILAQAVSVILSLLIIRKRALPFTIKKSDFSFNSEVRRFVRIGAPISFQGILTDFSFLALCAFINNLGLDASSGYGVASKIGAFIMLVPGSLMQSMASFVSQNVGAGREDRATQAMFTGMGIGCTIGVFIALLSFFHGNILASFFSDDPAVIARAWEYMRGFSSEAVVTSALFSFMGYFNGHARTAFVMAQGLAQTFLVRLPVSWYMSIQPNASLTMIGLAAP